MDKQTIYENYMKNYAAPDYEPAVAQKEVDSIMSFIPHKMLKFSNQPCPTAYATRSKNFGLSGIYNIYVNPNNEKSKNDLLLHEEGHIVYGHLQTNNFNEKIFSMKVKLAWPTLKKAIQFDEKDASLSEKELQEIYIKKISRILLNYAMDYEVNSKLFTIEEFNNFTKRLENDYMKTSLEKESISEEDYEKLMQEKDANPDKPLSKGLWPEDVGFPCKLSFTQYIDLMIANPEDFFKKVKFSKKKSMQPNISPDSEDCDGDDDSMSSSSGESTDDSYDEDNDTSSGSSSGENNNNEENDDSSSGSSEEDEDSSYEDETLTSSDFHDMEEEAYDMDEEAMNKLTQEALEKDAETESGDLEDEDSIISDEEDNNGSKDKKDNEEENDDDSNFDGNTKNVAQNAYSPQGTGEHYSEIISIKNSKDLENKIIEEIFNKTITNSRSDIVYNYNRNKYNTNVLIPKLRAEQLWRPGNVILVVDCSGSIEDKAISTIIGCVKKVAKKCGPKSRIIWWDTYLEGDYPLNKAKGPSRCGATDIAGGIRYAKKYLKQSNDKLIVVSDYADSLKYWESELSKIKHDAVGICWLKSRGSETPFSYVNNFIDDDKLTRKLLKKLPTTLVNISK